MSDAVFRASNGQSPEEHFKTIILSAQPTEADCLLAGQYLRGQIRQRTFGDQDLAGGNFIPYSPRYAKRKGQTNVDLYSRGPGNHMLDALTVRSGMSEGTVGSDAPASEISIGIYGDDKMAQRAMIHNEGGTGRTRQGTSKHIAPRLSRKFGVEIRRQTKGGKGTFNMPQRSWLGARMEDLDNMRRLIIDAIQDRLSRL